MAVTNAEVTRVPTLAASSEVLHAGDRNRRGLLIHNESDFVLYVKCGENASITDYTTTVPPHGRLNLKGNPIYVGLVTGRLASGTGFAQVTEFYG